MQAIAYRLVSRTTDEFINIGNRRTLAEAIEMAVMYMGLEWSDDWRIEPAN